MDRADTDQRITALLDEINQATPAGKSRSGEMWSTWDAMQRFQVPLGTLLYEDRDIRDSFHEVLQAHGKSAGLVTLDNLITWLLRRAARTRGAQAVAELRAYLARESVPCDRVMLLSSPLVYARYDLGGGVWLVPLSTISSSRLQEQVAGQGIPIFGGELALNSALVTAASFPRQSSVATLFVDNQAVESADARLMDALRILTLSRPEGLGVQGLATVTAFDDSLPVLHFGSWNLHPVRGPTFPPNGLTPKDVQETQELLALFQALPVDDRCRLSVALSQFGVAAACGLRAVERAVALRTALESLYLDGKKDEEGLLKKLKQRAAWFLKDVFDPGMKIERLVDCAYEICSRAVHEGTLPDEPAALSKRLRGRPYREWLDLAARLIRATLVKLIHNPRPQWPEIPEVRPLPLTEDVVAKLLDSFRSAGLGQSELAEGAGVAEHRVGAIFSGLSVPSMDEIVKLSSALHLSVQIRIEPSSPPAKGPL